MYVVFRTIQGLRFFCTTFSHKGDLAEEDKRGITDLTALDVIPSESATFLHRTHVDCLLPTRLFGSR